MATNTWTSDRRLYLDSAGRVVEADDPARATLLVADGGTLPLADAERYGLIRPEKAKAEIPANKSRAKKPANKGDA